MAHKKIPGLRPIRLTEIPLATRVAAAKSVPSAQRDEGVLMAAFLPSDTIYWVPAHAVEELVAA